MLKSYSWCSKLTDTLKGPFKHNIYLFIFRRLNTQDKITKQWQNDNVILQSKVPVKQQNIQNIKSQNQKFMSPSWGPAGVTSLKWHALPHIYDQTRWLIDTCYTYHLHMHFLHCMGFSKYISCSSQSGWVLCKNNAWGKYVHKCKCTNYNIIMLSS